MNGKRIIALILCLLLAVSLLPVGALADDGGADPEQPVDTDGDADKPTDGDADKPTDGDGDKPTDGDADKPTDGDADKPTDGDADKPTDGDADKPTDGDADKPTDGDADKPTDGDGDKPADGDILSKDGKDPLPEEDVYSVVGEPIFGTSWDVNSDAYVMALHNDGCYYITVHVSSSRNDLVAFKVVKNHSWDTCWPTDDNYKIKTVGTGDLAIKFDPDSKAITVTGDIVFWPDETPEALYIAGTWNDWTVNGLSMTHKGHYLWEAEADLGDGDMEFKFTYGNWDNAIGNNTDTPYTAFGTAHGVGTKNIAFHANAGHYKFRIQYDKDEPYNSQFTIWRRCTVTTSAESGYALNASPTQGYSGATITLSSSPAAETYYANGTALQGNTFTLGNEDVTVTATFSEDGDYYVYTQWMADSNALPEAIYKLEHDVWTDDGGTVHGYYKYVKKNALVLGDKFRIVKVEGGAITAQYPNNSYWMELTEENLDDVSTGTEIGFDPQGFPATYGGTRAVFETASGSRKFYKCKYTTVTVPATALGITKSITYGGGTYGQINGPSSASAGETVTLAVAPPAGFSIQTVTLTGANNAAVPFQRDGNNITFRMPSVDVTCAVTLLWDQQTPYFYAHSAVLRELIGLDFYIQVPDDFNSANAKMAFVSTDGAGIHTEIPWSKAELYSGNTIYKFTLMLKSVQMNDKVQPTFYYTADGTQQSITGSPYSIMDYINAVPTYYPNDAKLKALVASLANYGYAAQAYYKSIHVDFDDTDMAVRQLAYSYDTIKEAVYEDRFQVEGDTSNIRLDLSLNAQTKTLINVSIQMKDGAAPVIKQGDETLTGTALNTGFYRYVFGGYAPLQYGNREEITFHAGDGTLLATATFCVKSYIYTVLKNAADRTTEHKNFVCALYDLHMKALDYGTH